MVGSPLGAPTTKQSKRNPLWRRAYSSKVSEGHDKCSRTMTNEPLMTARETRKQGKRARTEFKKNRKNPHNLQTLELTNTNYNEKFLYFLTRLYFLE